MWVGGTGGRAADGVVRWGGGKGGGLRGGVWVAVALPKGNCFRVKNSAVMPPPLPSPTRPPCPHVIPQEEQSASGQRGRRGNLAPRPPSCGPDLLLVLRGFGSGGSGLASPPSPSSSLSVGSVCLSINIYLSVAIYLYLSVSIHLLLYLLVSWACSFTASWREKDYEQKGGGSETKVSTRRRGEKVQGENKGD